MIPLPSIAPVMRAHFPDGEMRCWVFGDEVAGMTYKVHQCATRDRVFPRSFDEYGIWLTVEYFRHGAKHTVDIRHGAQPANPYGGLMAVYYPGFFTVPVRQVWRVA